MESKSLTKEIRVKDIKIGGHNPLVLIAGPCVIESEKQAVETAIELKNICSKLKIAFIFKSSFDKANRTSIRSYRGPSLKNGLKILKKVKREVDVPILTDVHQVAEIKPTAEIADVIQIPALLCRQTDLIIAAAKSGRVVNVKKGQFLSPWEVKNIIEKITSAGNEDILITERGTTFGYNNLVADMRSLPIIRSFGYPVVFDATHSVQFPGGAGDASSGQREFVPTLARAAVAAGCDALFMEVHHNPDSALCDGPNMLRVTDLSSLLKQVKEIDALVRKYESA